MASSVEPEEKGNDRAAARAFRLLLDFDAQETS